MYTLSDIYMLETSHYIQSLSDQYIIESYTCESFKDTIHNLIEKIKKMFNKVKEFFKKLFGKNTNNDKKLEDIENNINNNPQLKNEKIEVVDTSKFDKIVDNANKQGKKITAKQIIAAAGITTATIGAIILGIKKFKKNTPNELEKQEKEAIKKAEDIKKEEDKVVNNNNNTTNTEPKTIEKKINYKLANNKYKGNGTRQKVNTTIKTKFIPKKAVIGLPEKSSVHEVYKQKNEQEMIKLQNKLEKINAIIKINNDKIGELLDMTSADDNIRKKLYFQQLDYRRDRNIDKDIVKVINRGDTPDEYIRRKKEYDEYIKLRKEYEMKRDEVEKADSYADSISNDNVIYSRKVGELKRRINNLK